MTAQVNTISPWLTIWVKPRGTIRRIVDTNPKHQVILLAWLWGSAQTLDGSLEASSGDTLSLLVILIFSAVLGPIGGLITFYINGVILRWTGSWLGGQASSVEVRAAFAWSSVPQIFAMVLWIPILAIGGSEAFTNAWPKTDALLGVIGAIIGVWNLIIFLKCLGEVHRFSAWRALAALAIPVLAIVVPILCIAFLLA